MSAPVVMIVDDNGDDLAIALRAIERAALPVQVRTVRSGREALEVLQIGNGPARQPLLCPRVIFLDLRMPQIGGFDVLRALRSAAHTRSIPVVVISSSARPEDVHLCYELGANSYLVKRFDPRAPGGYLAEAARYWLQLNEVSGQGVSPAG